MRQAWRRVGAISGVGVGVGVGVGTGVGMCSRTAPVNVAVWRFQDAAAVSVASVVRGIVQLLVVGNQLHNVCARGCGWWNLHCRDARLCETDVAAAGWLPDTRGHQVLRVRMNGPRRASKVLLQPVKLSSPRRQCGCAIVHPITLWPAVRSTAATKNKHDDDAVKLGNG